MEIEHDLLEMYRDPALDVKPALLEKRGGAFYSEAAAMLLESLATDRGDTQVVNVRNDGAIPNLADDAVVEVPCRDRRGRRPPQAAAAAAAGDARPRRAGEGVRAPDRAAAVTGDRAVALQALMANPLVASFDVARPLLDALLDAHREHLPQFFA